MYTRETMAAITDAPLETKAILGFNRVSGELVFNVYNVELKDLSGEEYMVFVEADFDANTQVVVGTYPDYKIVNKSDLPTDVYESELDRVMAQKITKRYPIAEQVNVLGRAIKTLASEHNIVLEELEEMLDYINLVRDTNREHKESYANDPGTNFITNASLEEQASRLYAGGLHEALGPREVTGGRIFH